jgi:hypothetical protein
MRFRTTARPEMMRVVERLLQVFVALRVFLPDSADSNPEVLVTDYQAVRTRLRNLPLVPADRALSSQSLDIAAQLYDRLENGAEQLTLPDHSELGHKFFTRQQAVSWTGLAYNTVKRYLRELEEEGILRSTVAENNRERGRQIHFFFVSGKKQPFAWMNPFEALPDLKMAPDGA